MRILNTWLIPQFKIWVIKRYKLKVPHYMFYDRTLLWLILGLAGVGFVMVTSASMPIGARLFNDPFYFAKRDIVYLSLAFFLSLIILRISMIIWQHYSFIMLSITLLSLIIVLVVGNSVNGASRWIIVGSMCVQPAELSKLTLFCYLANYLARKNIEIRTSVLGFYKPMGVMMLLAILLLIQPDLGTVVVMFVTTVAMLFLAGARLWQFLSVICFGIFTIMLLIISKPYRIQRIISFWNPWGDPFGSGYQLTQSLMAFGRGEFWGQGLGNSIQKLEYLPEAHTDFIFAIIGEELGYFGVLLLLIMVFFISLRAMFIGRKALKINQYFSGFLACSIGIWFSFQTLINIGATAGILPTKGLTLPLISYGGSSLLIMSIAIVLLLRIDFETRLAKSQAFIRRSR